MTIVDGRSRRKRDVPIRYCIVCGEAIQRNTKQGQSRIIIKQYEKAEFCSTSCRGVHQSKNNIGRNNKNWKGGISDDRSKKRGCKEYRLWRLSIFQRDKFTCIKCHKYGGNLNAHHIESFNNNQDLIFNVNNGITFCEDCHKKFHKKYGQGNNNVEQLSSFIR